MRIAQPGITRSAECFTFTFDGEPITAFPGETIAAALVAARRTTCRETRAGEPRGVFCGMGVCGECSVIVDGRARRACMEMAAPGQRVERQPAWRSLPESPPPPGASPGVTQWRDVDILVVGAGPAGLAAAAAAARSGANVLVVDERAKAGGQYFKQPGSGFAVDETRIDAQFAEGIALYRDAAAAGAEFLFGATVWGAFPGPEISVSTDAGNLILSARRIIVSPGAYERPLPFPGWTLPGVMTTGAAQTLLRAYQTAPGERVLVAGNGPLNLQVARELDAAGARVVAVVELARGPSLGGAVDAVRMSIASPGLVLAGAGHLLRLIRSRVPVLYRHVVVEASGEGRVSEVAVAPVGSDGAPVAGQVIRFDVDTVCLGYGFQAQSEIARALGAEYDMSTATGASSCERDSCGRTSSPAVFVTGDARGLGGARVAMAQGALAGAEAARDLGHAADGALRRALRRHRRDLRRHRRFQRALWSFYAAPPVALSVANRDTIICRCESVTLGRVEEVLSAGVGSLGALKRETRAGMGRCQGRYCAALLAQAVRGSGCPVQGDDAFFAPRPPFKPLAIADIAGSYDAALTFDRSAGVSTRPGAGEVPGAAPPLADDASAEGLP